MPLGSISPKISPRTSGCGSQNSEPAREPTPGQKSNKHHGLVGYRVLGLSVEGLGLGVKV